MDQKRDDDWNPLDAAVLEDQRRAYDQMRERCPVVRHEDIATVLSDPGTYSNASRYLAIPNGMDPPVHGQCRDALGVFFSQDQMEPLELRARVIHRPERDQARDVQGGRTNEAMTPDEATRTRSTER